VLEQINNSHPFECTRIDYHMSWPGTDPFYLANTVEANDRRYYYSVGYVPYVRIDGILDGLSSGPWEQMMLDRYALDSPLTIDLSGEMTSAVDGSITAIVTNTSAAAVSGQLRIVLVESDIPYSGKNWNYVMRDFIGEGTTGEAISLGPGQGLSRNAPFTLDPSWVRGNMTAVAFVQDDVTKEIYQSARIFFELDQPELVYDGMIIDDSVGGNGNGHLDPGETASVSIGLANINPVTGTMVSGTLATADPLVTISDDAGTWPDIDPGETQHNTADSFVIAASPNAPWGHDVTLALTLDANGSTGIKTLTIRLPLGSPDNPIGPDAYGYYAYEDLDNYEPSPVYNWVEIDPTLGGPGAVFTLTDDQTRNMALPFTFKYYGQDFTSVSICSNGWIAMGVTTDHTVSPGPIPGPDGPPNMVAAFWCDLNPSAAGGGKVYTYHDQAGGRFIIEFSGVEHYHDQGLGLPETFEFILYNPSVYPTPTGDGGVVLQYALVNDPAGCAVGIENSTETIGIQYWNSGLLNGAAYGLAAGRAINFTTAIPSSAAVPAGLAGNEAVLLMARPNPMHGTAQVHYYLPSAGDVTLRVFSLEGAVVRTLLQGQAQAGPGVVSWDGRSDRGITVPAGVYFFRLSGPGLEVERKIVLQR
jgi:hypothetical protein